MFWCCGLNILGLCFLVSFGYFCFHIFVGESVYCEVDEIEIEIVFCFIYFFRLGNQIGDEGARAISDGLKINKTLTSIVLAGMRLFYFIFIFFLCCWTRLSLGVVFVCVLRVFCGCDS